jgi:hypothetical protein
MANHRYHWECEKSSQNWSGGPLEYGRNFKYAKTEVKETWHLVSWAELSIVPQLVFVQAGGHFSDVMGLKLYYLQQRCKHAFWDDLQDL